MSNIVFLTTYSFDEPVVKNRLTPFMDLALDRGISVTLVNPAGGNYHRDSDKQFRHVALNIPQANRGNFLVRTFCEMRLAQKVLDSAPKGSDYAFVTIPSMFLLFLSGRIRASKRLLDIRDLTWEYLSDKGVVTQFAKRFFRLLARRKIPTFDYVSVTNRAEETYLKENLSLPPTRIILTPNGITQAQFDNVSPESTRKPSNSRPLVAYVGNVGVAQNLVTLVNAARRLPNFDFKIVGGGSDYERVAAEAANTPNVIMTGRVDWPQIPPVYREADILYAQLSADFAGAMPSKLYEYLATGKPVIYGGVGEATDVLSQFDGIKIVPPDDSEALATGIDELIQARANSEINHANRDLIAANYIRETAADSFYQKVLDE